MKLVLFLCVSSLLLFGCAGAFLDGRIVNKVDGSAMPMKIQKSYGRGKMEAVNIKTGEKFSGSYTAISDDFSGAVTNYSNMRTYNYHSSSRRANAKAFLLGDQGTTLDVVMEIQKGITPIGFGEARDNKGNVYHVEF